MNDLIATSAALSSIGSVCMLALVWIRWARARANALPPDMGGGPSGGSTDEAALMTIDAKDRVVEANAVASALLGIPLKTLPGLTLQRALGEYPELLALATDPSRSCGQIFTGKTAVTRRCHEVRVTSMEGRGPRSRRLLSIRDVTAEDLNRASLLHKANFDSLTGLANRRLFLNTLDRSLDEARQSGTRMALLCLDLDRLKDINDSLGHPAGDELIRTVAHRLRQGVRSTSVVPAEGHGEPKPMLVSRVGGDEFSFLIPAITSPEQASAVAEHVLQLVAQPVTIGAQAVWSTGSVGIAIFPEDGDEPERLVKSADCALYDAKRRQRGSFSFYRPELDAANQRLIALEAALRGAIERSDLELHYQPKIDARSNEVVGCEALLRWTHDELGPIPPKEFIPIAESSGLIIDLGAWVIERACRQIREWLDNEYQAVRVAVNVSSHQIQRTELDQVVTEALRFYQVDPSYLEIELTESALLEDDEETSRKLRDLRSIGVRVALDDFGTGYSALSYLTRFPLDVLKMDRAFVRDIHTDPSAAGIAGAVINMAQTLALEVVAEGVDSEEQLALLRKLGCDQIQGFLFSPAVPAAEFAATYLESDEGRAQGRRPQDPGSLNERGAEGPTDESRDADLPARPETVDLDARRYALVVDEPDGTLAMLTLRLNQLGVPALYARDADEGVLFAAQEPGRVRALVLAPTASIDQSVRVAQRVASFSAGEHPTFVLVGASRVATSVLQKLAPVWVLNAPVDDACLQESVAAAMGVRLRDRGAPRVALDATTWIHASGGSREFGLMSSLSAKGAFIEMRPTLAVGTNVDLEFEISQAQIKCSAMVIYQRHDSSVDGRPSNVGIGVIFTDTDDETMERISAEVEARAAPNGV